MFETQIKKNNRRFTPHNYQKRGIKAIVESGAMGLFWDPGLGKTGTVLAAIKLLLSRKMITKVLVLAPLRVCYSTWPVEVKKWLDFKDLCTSVIHGSPKKRKEALEADADIYVMNYEGLKWLSEQKGWHFDMLVVDECFPYDTEVLTSKGRKKIGCLSYKDKVLSSDGNYYGIKSIIVRASFNLVHIKLASRRLTCTPSHPIMTSRGWVLAAELRRGDMIYGVEDLQILWERIQCEGVKSILQQTLSQEWASQNMQSLWSRVLCKKLKSGMLLSKVWVLSWWKGWSWKIQIVKNKLCYVWQGIPTQKSPNKILQPILCGKAALAESRDKKENLYERIRTEDIIEHERKKQRACSLEQKQTYAPGIKTKIERSIKGHTPQTSSSRWQRARLDGASRTDASNAWQGMACRVRNISWETVSWISNKLQSGFGTYRAKASDRAGWSHTQEQTSSGCEKRQKITGARVESIEVVELGRPETVYNLELNGTPHYFANNVLVHNCSKFKNSGTQRWKLMKALIKKFPRRYILTGTPAPRSLMNLFGQIFLLDTGASLGRYITHFRSKYFYQTEKVVATVNITQANGRIKRHKVRDWEMQDGAEAKIYDAIRHLVIRMDAEDYLELPPLIKKDIIVELPTEVKRIYKDLERDYIAAIESGEIVAANAAVASQKCRQVANGGIYTHGAAPEAMLEDAIKYFKTGVKVDKTKKGRQWEELHMAKAEAVADLIDELEGQPALIAYEFEHDLVRLKKVLGKDTPHIGSGVSPKRSQAIIDAWNRGEVPALLGQPASMSHGLNMQEAGRAVIYHSMIWDLEAYEQFYKRVWRQGQKDPVFLYHILADVSIDFAVKIALQSKHRTQKSLLDAFREVIR